MKAVQSRYSSVVVLRVLGMMLIILCHIIPYYTFVPGSQMLGQVFNVGVEVFLLISGYLYGGKVIKGFDRWFFGRWTRICLPVVLISVIIWTILTLAAEPGAVSVGTLIPYLLCAQGLPFVSYSLFHAFIREMPELGPLWFITIILLCYLAVPLLQWIKLRLTSKNDRATAPILLVVLFVVSFVLSLVVDLNLNYLAVFTLGYLLGSRSFGNEIRLPLFLVGTGAMLFTQGIRILLRLRTDGTPLYLSVVPITQTALAAWIVLLVFYLHTAAPRLINSLGQSRFLLWLDRMSFFVYLTHAVFCTGSLFNMYALIDNLGLASLAFFACTTASALGLYWLYRGITAGAAALTGRLRAKGS